jgi:hypothetical protein
MRNALFHEQIMRKGKKHINKEEDRKLTATFTNDKNKNEIYK